MSLDRYFFRFQGSQLKLNQDSYNHRAPLLNRMIVLFLLNLTTLDVVFLYRSSPKILERLTANLLNQVWGYMHPNNLVQLHVISKRLGFSTENGSSFQYPEKLLFVIVVEILEEMRTIHILQHWDIPTGSMPGKK